jgi:hypothetical protein
MKPAPTDPHTGSPVARYRTRPLHWGEFLRLAGLGLAAVLAPMLYGMSLYNRSLARYGPVAAERWSTPWLSLSLAALGFFVVLAALRLAASRRSVELFQKGLRLNQGRRIFLPWNQIAGVSTEVRSIQGLPAGEKLRYRARLHPTTGPSIRLGEQTENLPELLSQIKAHLYPRLLPALREELHNGRWLHFGEIAICSHGLRLGSNQRRRLDLAWTEIQAVQVQHGQLTIDYAAIGKDHASPQPQNTNHHAALRQRRLETGGIPNIELLLQLIQQEVTP